MTSGSDRVTIDAASGWFVRAARRSWSWLRNNVDTFTGLATAATVTVLDVLDITSPNVRDNAILAVLGILAIAVIRNRSRDEARGKAIAADARRTGKAMEQVGVDLAEIDRALEQRAEIQILRGAEIERDLATVRNGARSWLVRSGPSAYVRTVTLPRVVEQARTDGHELWVRLEILDPTVHQVCDQYVSYCRPQLDRTVTRRQVEHDCYATILACCWQRQRYPRLRLEIGLSQIIHTMRWELFDDALFIAPQFAAEPTLKVPHGRVLHEWARTELDTSFEQSRLIDLKPARTAHLGAGVHGPTHTEVRDLFRRLALPMPAAYGDADLDAIVKHALPTGTVEP